MRQAAAALLVMAAALAAPAGAAPPIKLPQPILLTSGAASATASPASAGATPAALTLKLTYPMTCNQPGAGPLVVTLPAALQLPSSLAADSVLVRGRAARSLRLQGRTVVIGLPRPGAQICSSTARRTLTIQFTQAAQLGNPPAPGSYPVTVRVGGRAFTARLAITL